MTQTTEELTRMGRTLNVTDMLRAVKSNEDFDEGEFLTMIMSKFGVSHRTAKEYLDVSKYRLRIPTNKNGKLKA